MKSNNNLFYSFLIILFTTGICLLCLKKLNYFSYVRKSNATNNLSNIINANETILVRENFENSLTKLDSALKGLNSNEELKKHKLYHSIMYLTKKIQMLI